MSEYTYSYPYEEKDSVKIKTKKQLFDTFLNYPWESKFLEMDEEEREFSSDKVPFCEGARNEYDQPFTVEWGQYDTNQYQALELPTLKLNIIGMEARIKGEYTSDGYTESFLVDDTAKLVLLIQKYGYGPYGFSATLGGAPEWVQGGFFSSSYAKFSGQWYRHGISREHILVILNSLFIGDLRCLQSIYDDGSETDANNPWSDDAYIGGSYVNNKTSIIKIMDYMAKRFEKKALTNYDVFLEMLGSMSPYFNKSKDADKWVFDNIDKSQHRYPYKSNDDEIYKEMWGWFDSDSEEHVEGANEKVEKIEEEMKERSNKFLKKILEEDIKELTNKIGFDAEGKNYKHKDISGYHDFSRSVPVHALKLLRKKLKRNIITNEEFTNIGNIFIDRKDVSTELMEKFKKEFKDSLIENGDESLLNDLISDFTSGETYREDSYKLLKNYRKEKVGEELEKRELYDEAEEWYSHNRMTKKATEMRKKKADMSAPKTEINIDDRDTIIKDSVINRSNIASNGDDKFAKLERLTKMKKEGLIDDDEFKQMKKEILR